MAEDHPCPLCGGAPSATLDYINTEPDFEDVFGHLKIAVCERCGFGNTVPHVPAADLGRFYAGSFTPRFLERVANGDFPFFDERSVAQIMLARQYVDFEAGDVFVDLGAGVGVSLFSASRLLDAPKLIGIELNDQAIALMRTHMPAAAIVADVPAAKAAAGEAPIRMVLTSHSMEHFNGDEVVDVLREVLDLLAPGGVVMIEVPLWDLRPESPAFWPGRWRDTPHLSFFSKPALERLVEASGFRLAYCNHYGLPRDWPQDFDTVRRKTTDWKIVSGGGAHFLLIAQSAQMRPRPNGKVLRAVGIKPAL